MRELGERLAPLRAGIDYIEHELVANADSEQEAEDIAAAYGGTLKSYGLRVAVITIEMTVKEAAALAERSGTLPKASPNYIYHTATGGVNERN